MSAHVWRKAALIVLVVLAVLTGVAYFLPRLEPPKYQCRDVADIYGLDTPLVCCYHEDCKAVNYGPAEIICYEFFIGDKYPRTSYPC